LTTRFWNNERRYRLVEAAFKTFQYQSACSFTSPINIDVVAVSNHLTAPATSPNRHSFPPLCTHSINLPSHCTNRPKHPLSAAQRQTVIQPPPIPYHPCAVGIFLDIVEESDLRRLWTGKEGNGKEGRGRKRGEGGNEDLAIAVYIMIRVIPSYPVTTFPTQPTPISPASHITHPSHPYLTPHTLTHLTPLTHPPPPPPQKTPTSPSPHYPAKTYRKRANSTSTGFQKMEREVIRG